jgi:hypothetical protein
MEQFQGGATRDSDAGKFDYEGFLSPLALEAYAAYMDFNRITAAGLRDSDNWQKGIPIGRYMKCAWRHFVDVWKEHRGITTKEGLVWALCAVLFNIQGYLHELLKANPYLLTKAIAEAEKRRAATNARQSKPRPSERSVGWCPDLAAAYGPTIDCVPMTDAVKAAGRPGKKRLRARRD